jgi:hypothetical protein
MQLKHTHVSNNDCANELIVHSNALTTIRNHMGTSWGTVLTIDATYFGSFWGYTYFLAGSQQESRSHMIATGGRIAIMFAARSFLDPRSFAWLKMDTCSQHTHVLCTRSDSCKCGKVITCRLGF